jgi:hypothetical protein
LIINKTSNNMTTAFARILLVALITVVVVASEKVNQPKSFSRRAFVPRTDHRFHTSSGLGGFDHELVQEVSAKAAKPVTPSKSFWYT